MPATVVRRRLAKRATVERLPMIIGIVLGVVVFNAIILVSYCILKRRRARDKRNLIVHPGRTALAADNSTDSLSKMQGYTDDISLQRPRKPSQPTTQPTCSQTMMTLREKRGPVRGKPSIQTSDRRPEQRQTRAHDLVQRSYSPNESVSSNGRRLRTFSFPPAQPAAVVKPPLAVPAPAPAGSLRRANSIETASIYSSGSAPMDAHERMFQSFAGATESKSHPAARVPSVLLPHMPAVPIVATALPPHMRAAGGRSTTLPWGKRTIKATTVEETSSAPDIAAAIRWIEPVQEEETLQKRKQGSPPLTLSAPGNPSPSLFVNTQGRSSSTSTRTYADDAEEEDDSPVTPEFAPSAMYAHSQPQPQRQPSSPHSRSSPPPPPSPSHPTPASPGSVAPLAIRKTTTPSTAVLSPNSLFYDRLISNPNPKGMEAETMETNQLPPPGIPLRSPRRMG